MKMKSTLTLLLAACAVFAVVSPAAAKMKAASEVAPPPHDPKKKKAGEECQSADECQVHHTCTKSGEKNVCTAPPRRTLPPGVVT